MAGDGTVVVEDVGSSGRVLLMVGDVLEVLAWAWVGFAMHWCWKMFVAVFSMVYWMCICLRPWRRFCVMPSRRHSHRDVHYHGKCIGRWEPGL